MGRKDGTSLIYSVEGSVGFLKNVQEVISGFDKKLKMTPSEQLEIQVWPEMIRWISGDYRVDYCRDTDSLTIKGDRHIKNFIVESFSKEVDLNTLANQITPRTIPTRKQAKLNAQRVSLVHHRLDISGGTLDLWSTTTLNIPPSTTKLIWAVWLKGVVSEMPRGIPYQFDYRDADHPEKIWMKLKLKEVVPLTQKPPLPKVIKAPIGKEPTMHAVTEDPKPEVHFHHQLEGINWSGWWQANEAGADGRRKMGVAYAQPALNQVAAAVNHVISRLGSLTGSYDYTNNELVVDWNIWGRLSPLLIGSNESLNALPISVVAAHLLGGGEPVMYWQREGGLTAMEYTRLQLLRKIMATFRYSDGRWSADSEAYFEIDDSKIQIPMDGQHQTPECAAVVKHYSIFYEAHTVINKIQDVVDNHASGSAAQFDPEIIKILTHLYMIGFTDFSDFGEIVFITLFVDPRDLEHTALGTWSEPPQLAPAPWGTNNCRRTINQHDFMPGFNRRRAEAFINAQMEQLLGIRVRIPKQELQKTSHIINGSVAFAGPIYNFNITPGSIALANLRHVDPVEYQTPFTDDPSSWRRQLQANLKIASTQASLSLGLHLNESTRWLIILGLSLFLPLVGLAIVPGFARGSASISLRDVDIPVTLDFIPSNEGYNLTLHNTPDQNGQPSATIGDDQTNYHFPWPVDSLVAIFRGEFTKMIAMLLSHVFGTNEFDRLAIVKDAKMPLPWPQMLKLQGGPAITRYEPQYDADHLAVWRALWTLPPDIGAGLPLPGHVDLQDIDSLGYLFTPSSLSAWLRAMLSIPGVRNLSHADAFLRLRGVQLPALSQYPDTDRLTEDREQRTLMASRFVTFCGGPPAVAAPTRSYRMQFTIHAPRVNLQEGEHDHVIGDFVFNCHLRIDAVQSEEYAVVELANSGGAAIPIDGTVADFSSHISHNSGEPDSIDITDEPTADLPDEGDVPGNHTNFEETRYPESGALAPDDPFGVAAAGCRWLLKQEDYVLSTIVDGSIDVTGQLQLGFSATPSTLDFGAIDPEIILPKLALAPARDEQGQLALQLTAHFDLADDLSSDQQSKLRTEIEAMCQQEIQRIITVSRPFGHSSLTGSRQVLPLPSQIMNALPTSVRRARWIQLGSGLGTEENWNPVKHTFHYVVRNGHAVWPIELQFDLPALLT